MKSVTIKAKPRELSGKGASGRLRRTGWIPAVIYGEGVANRNVQFNEHEFVQMMKAHKSEHLIMDLAVEGESARKVLLKDLQHHPVSGRVIHADFQEISMTKKLRVEIPIKLVGEPLGISQQGGILEHIVRTVEVECLPTDIPEQVELDVSALMIGDRRTIGDIQLDPAKFHVISAKDLAVATVVAPKAEEEVAAPAEGEAAAEPEVITEKKAEGEEGEAAAEGAEKKGAKGEEKKPAGKEEAKKAEAPAGKEPAAAADKKGKEKK